MIARPVHRPRPIPFDTQYPVTSHTQTRAVSWASALGTGAPAPAAMPSVATSLPRLSPVKVSLSVATAHRSATPNSAATPHDVGGPRHNQKAQVTHTVTEISARYIGHGALSVRSSVTGRHYRFQGHGDSQVIDRHDVVLLKRISDLVIR